MIKKIIKIDKYKKILQYIIIIILTFSLCVMQMRGQSLIKVLSNRPKTSSSVCYILC